MTIPSAVKYIGDFAFNGCSNLVGDLIIPTVTYIGLSSFLNCCGFDGSLSISEKVTTIKAKSFCSKLSGSLKILLDVSAIEERAFYSM